jgi:hypothetical protein
MPFFLFDPDYYKIKKATGMSQAQEMSAYLGGSLFQTIMDNPVTVSEKHSSLNTLHDSQMHTRTHTHTHTHSLSLSFVTSAYSAASHVDRTPPTNRHSTTTNTTHSHRTHE